MWDLGNRKAASGNHGGEWNLAWLAAMVFAACLAGCATTGRNPSEPLVRNLHLFCAPVAVNLDSQPGPDGFSVRVYATGSKSSKSILIPTGRLELMMFDGILTERPASLPEPLKTWRFTGSELTKHAGRSAVGTGYRFTLRWEEARPSQSRISIVARYVPASGPSVVSAPSSVAIGTK